MLCYKVAAVPNSGWFPVGNHARDRKADFAARMRHMYEMVGADATLDPACVAGRGYLCLFAPSAMRFVKTPTFALNSMYVAAPVAPSRHLFSGGTLFIRHPRVTGMTRPWAAATTAAPQRTTAGGDTRATRAHTT